MANLPPGKQTVLDHDVALRPYPFRHRALQNSHGRPRAQNLRRLFRRLHALYRLAAPNHLLPPAFPRASEKATIGTVGKHPIMSDPKPSAKFYIETFGCQM